MEGILVRGETHFVLVNGCRVSNLCPTSGCRGEDACHTTEFAEHMPETDDGEDEVFDGDLEDRVDRLEDQVGATLVSVKRIDKELSDRD